MGGWRDILATLLAGRGQELKQYAYLICGSSTEAEDLVQTALVKVLGRPGSGHLRSPEAYVKRVIANEYLDRSRAHRTWLRYLPRLVPPSGEQDWTAEVADRDDVRVSLFALSPRQRACVVLRFYEDLTVPQIAEALGCSEGTVKRNLSESMDRLRRHFAPTS